MTMTPDARDAKERGTTSARQRLLDDIPVVERSLDAAGIPTAVLEGGDGPPVVLLHGPGEAAVNWRWVIPDLVTTHRVIAPDLPAHGSTGTGDDDLDEDRVVAWLDELLAQTCRSAPVLSATCSAARSARGTRSATATGSPTWCSTTRSGWAPSDRPGGSRRPSSASWPGRPSAPTSGSWASAPTTSTSSATRWETTGPPSWPTTSSSPAPRPRRTRDGCSARSACPASTQQDLAGITVPTTLIWGRHDRALRLPLARAASERYGWPLHVIEDAADDPARDQPEAFLRALRAAITPRSTSRGGTP
jgi:pimeloyl-ACP methyl ester carboxylesterase